VNVVSPADNWGLSLIFGSPGEVLRAHARARPRQLAVRCEDRAVDWAELDALMDRVAATLQHEGIEPTQAVAICAATSIQYLAVFLGAIRAGVAVAPISPALTPRAIAAMIADSGARRVFLDRANANALESAGIAPAAPVTLFDGAPSFASWLRPPGSKPAHVEPRPEWPFNIIYSSGTTGEPKGIVQPFAMRWTHMQRGPAHGYDADSTTLISTPLYSNTTLVSVFPALATGGSVVLMPRFDAQRYLELAERVRATHTMLVPVQYQRLMAREDFGRYDLAAFRGKFSTSAPFPAALKRDVLARWPGGLTEFYGMTEGGGTCVLQAHVHREKLHTVGLPAAGHDIRLIDDAGREVARGGTGEVVGWSPASRMTGYHNRPEATAAAEWVRDGKRFIRTGDIGRFDDDGFLQLVDRRKDMIISGGFNIYPGDLEAVLREHPAVAEVSVVGMPSAEWGETPFAFVVCRPGIDADADEIRAWANERLGRMHRVAEVRVLPELPRSSIGKVLKRELRALYSPTAPRSAD
jgi:acyl-CoA synthetase (AMP-forming)/AMP-acid ligase II